ncbi:MAG: hypothetical protein HY301_04100 [Verrucomicrobia bacterium]|nr:hypothetical protein [Verrucomicrobiota bacterium]
MKLHRLAFLPVAILALTATAAQREFTDEQLQQWLKRYPEADTNKDGKLSLEEARAYYQKVRAGTATESDAKSKGRAGKKAQRSADAPKPDFADASYGPHANNKLDLWLAKSDKPTALVVFIHGGGFVAGDKSSFSGAMLKECLDAGVSFAAINYRFRTEASINTVLRDSARAPVSPLPRQGLPPRQAHRRLRRLGGRGHVALARVSRRPRRSEERRPGVARIHARERRRRERVPGDL